jgi:hypothetical protein
MLALETREQVSGPGAAAAADVPGLVVETIPDQVVDLQPIRRSGDRRG